MGFALVSASGLLLSSMRTTAFSVSAGPLARFVAPASVMLGWSAVRSTAVNVARLVGICASGHGAIARSVLSSGAVDWSVFMSEAYYSEP